MLIVFVQIWDDIGVRLSWVLVFLPMAIGHQKWYICRKFNILSYSDLANILRMPFLQIINGTIILRWVSRFDTHHKKIPLGAC